MRIPLAPRVFLILTAALGLLAGCHRHASTEAPTDQPAVGVTPTPPPAAAKGCGLPRGTGSGEGCPLVKASYRLLNSRKSTLSDQPSATM